ncbi:MAG: hypothetical protein K2M08_03170 [Anaeroplasmataceae bacterium]|nr:hypothetical protein [Anaeroplasmataceae bacterium]
MRIIGRIYKTQNKNRLVAIKTHNRILYLHFQNSQFSQFRRYLYPGTYIDLDYDEEKNFTKNGIAAYLVNYVHQIYRINLFQKILYYDRMELNGSLADFLNSLGNILFLDLEMTMPSYNFSGKGYRMEIIQAGYVLVNGKGDEISRYNNYIQPKIHKDISNRTLDFLNISREEFHRNAIPYSEFYEEFKMLVLKYQPSILIFGKNDKLILNDSFEIHNVENLSDRIRYVNLCKLIQTYYHLKNEPGLFKLYQTYYKNDEIQVHDAFNDSYVTMAVFNAFKKDVEHKTDFYSIIKEKF